MELNAIIEALIFASPEPITSKALARCIRARITGEREQELEDGKAAKDSDADAEDMELEAEADEAPSDVLPGGEFTHVKTPDIERGIEELNAAYEEQGRSFRILEGPNGWRMYTTPEYADWIQELFPGQKPAKLSPPAMETLAIIAYRQPISKADVEAVRGVSIDGVLQKIVDRGLVKVVGRAEILGRPLLYGTTDLFMEHFGIKKLGDLPNSAELRRIQLPQAAEKDSGAKGKERQMALSENPADEAPSEAEAKERTDSWHKAMSDSDSDAED